MERLMDIYDQIEDPLNDKDNLIEIIKAGLEEGTYGKLQKVNRIDTDQEYDPKEEKKYYERNNKKYLDNNKDTKTAEDEYGGAKWIHYQTTPGGDIAFYHVYSKRLFNRTKDQENLIKTRHRFYVNIPKKYVHKFAMLFEDKCEKAGLPYYYKFSTTARSDMFLVYANTLFLDRYLKILREIKRENPELLSHAGKPPIMSGRIDGWIGYGSEPAINDEIKEKAKAEGKDRKEVKTFSFTSLRTKAIARGVKAASKDIIKENINRRVNYNGKQYTFKEYVMIRAAEKLYKKWEKTINDAYKDNPNLPRIDHKKELIKKAINNADIMIDAYLNDDDNLFKYKNNPTVEECKNMYNRSHKILIDKGDIGIVMKEVLGELAEKDPQVAERFKKSILKEFEAKGIDTKKTCFDNDIVDNIKKRDIKYQLRGGFDGVSIEPAPSNPVIAKIIEQENQQKKPKKNDNVRFLTPDELNKVFGEKPVKDKDDAKKFRFSTPEIMKEQVAKKGHIPDGHLKVGDYNKENIDEAIALYDKILAGLNKKDFKPLNPDEIRNPANREHFEPYDHAIRELPHHPKEDELKAMFAKEADKWGKEGKGRIS